MCVIRLHVYMCLCIIRVLCAVPCPLFALKLILKHLKALNFWFSKFPTYWYNFARKILFASSNPLVGKATDDHNSSQRLQWTKMLFWDFFVLFLLSNYSLFLFFWFSRYVICNTYVTIILSVSHFKTNYELYSIILWSLMC